MRVWRDISVVSLAVVVVTVPFLILNLQLRAAEGFSRSITEIESFSANVYGDLTAPRRLRLWGPLLRRFSATEGELFPGVVPIGLALLGVGSTLVGCGR